MSETSRNDGIRSGSDPLAGLKRGKLGFAGSEDPDFDPSVGTIHSTIPKVEGDGEEPVLNINQGIGYRCPHEIATGSGIEESESKGIAAIGR